MILSKLMLAQAIWWLGLAILALLIARGLFTGWFRRYPAFFSYLNIVFFVSLTGVYIYKVHPALYRQFYWYSEAVTMFSGFCIIWEIQNHVLAAYAGLRRITKVLIAAILIAGAVRLLPVLAGRSRWNPALTSAGLEREFRLVQGLVLAAIIIVLFCYEVPLTVNIRGLLTGYTVITAFSLVNLGLWAYLKTAWPYLQPAAYLGALLIWAVSLWRYAPVAATLEAPGDSYLRISAGTRQSLLKIRTYVAHGFGYE